jgi:transcriptional regulator with PAS, ATPase and Fis domain
MRKILLAWIGNTDLRAPNESAEVGLGPIAQALEARQFDEAVLLSNYEVRRVTQFVKWLRGRTGTQLDVVDVELSGPTQFGEIYESAVHAVQRALGRQPRHVSLTFHLSPGTPAMAAVWIILGKTRFPAELIESSKDHGVRTASVPFDMSVDFLPDLLREQDERLRQDNASEVPTSPEFADIIHRSRVMSRLIVRARRVAVRDVPILIEGESGTGKEMLARAIHKASPRRRHEFIAVNCGAIPVELVESELFGHEKGAFTGADRPREGHFQTANGGTLFLDEVGELPSAAQVKLLRAIQEQEIVRVGASKPIRVNVRILAATNRSMIQEINDGRFREDLFYRLAVAVLTIPPLRERTGDLGFLVDHMIQLVNTEAAGQPGFAEKKLSAGARNLLLSHPWPGNVRELLNTLRRVAIWSDGGTITADDVKDALLPNITSRRPEVLGRPLGNGFNIADLQSEVARHYLTRAMGDAGGNKTKAAELLGLPSYQTLSNWLAKYGISS